MATVVGGSMNTVAVAAVFITIDPGVAIIDSDLLEHIYVVDAGCSQLNRTLNWDGYIIYTGGCGMGVVNAVIFISTSDTVKFFSLGPYTVLKWKVTASGCVRRTTSHRYAGITGTKIEQNRLFHPIVYIHHRQIMARSTRTALAIVCSYVFDIWRCQTTYYILHITYIINLSCLDTTILF